MGSQIQKRPDANQFNADCGADIGPEIGRR